MMKSKMAALYDKHVPSKTPNLPGDERDSIGGTPRSKTYFSSLKHVIKQKPIFKKRPDDTFNGQKSPKQKQRHHAISTGMHGDNNFTQRSVDYGYSSTKRDIVPEFL